MILYSAHPRLLLALLPVLLLPPRASGGAPAPSEETARYVFAWRGVPVGTVTLSLTRGGRRFTYTSRHLHTRGGHQGERVREVVLELGEEGKVEGRESVPQALWLWRGPAAPGCVVGREELSGREGPHCLTAVEGSRAEGTMLGQPFTARYDGRGRLEALEVGEARFTALAPGVRLRPPPELFARGVRVEGVRGPLAFSPPWPAPVRPSWLTPWRAEAARALAEEVHAAFPEPACGP